MLRYEGLMWWKKKRYDNTTDTVNRDLINGINMGNEFREFSTDRFIKTGRLTEGRSMEVWLYNTNLLQVANSQIVRRPQLRSKEMKRSHEDRNVQWQDVNSFDKTGRWLIYKCFHWLMKRGIRTDQAGIASQYIIRGCKFFHWVHFNKTKTRRANVNSMTQFNLPVYHNRCNVTARELLFHILYCHTKNLTMTVLVLAVVY